jgi:hypothetical protein
VKGKLIGLIPETVELLEVSDVDRDELGQVIGEPQVVATVTASIQPLSNEATIALGLTGNRERLRVQLPPWVTVKPNGILRCRDADWNIVGVEQWPSYIVAIAENQ